MMNTHSDSYSICQTQQGIKLDPATPLELPAGLICLCHHYQSALRIAKQVAVLRQLPLIINTAIDAQS